MMQVAEAEAAFLLSLHAVARMAAEMQQLITRVVPADVASWPAAVQTQQLRQEAGQLAAKHREQKQV